MYIPECRIDLKRWPHRKQSITKGNDLLCMCHSFWRYILPEKYNRRLHYTRTCETIRHVKEGCKDDVSKRRSENGGDSLKSKLTSASPSGLGALARTEGWMTTLSDDDGTSVPMPPWPSDGIAWFHSGFKPISRCWKCSRSSIFCDVEDQWF